MTKPRHVPMRKREKRGMFGVKAFNARWGKGAHRRIRCAIIAMSGKRMLFPRALYDRGPEPPHLAPDSQPLPQDPHPGV